MTAPELPERLEPQEAARCVSGGGGIVLDVRERWEWELCRIDGALHIPLNELPARLAEVPADRPVVVTCHHGMRSMRAVTWLRRQGYAQVANLEGGIDRWSLEIDGSVARY